MLDDGADPDAGFLAETFGFTYVVRPDRGRMRKAGNLRYAFAHTAGELIVIFDADFDRLRVFFESQGISMPFLPPSDLADAQRRNHSGGRPLADVVRAELAATLHVDDSVSIDPTASLIDLGLDSLLALDLRRRLRRTVGRSAPVARMLGGITVSELIDVVGSGSPNGEGMRKVGIHA